MRSHDTESLTEEEINDLAVRTVRAIRAERAGASWDVRSVAAYLDCSRRHVRRLIAAGELEGERSADSRAWAIPVRSMFAFEDRRYAARVEADRRSPGARRAVVATEMRIVYERGEDGWIVASIPDAPGVFSQGRAREEARANVLDALNLMNAPEPSGGPAQSDPCGVRRCAAARR